MVMMGMMMMMMMANSADIIVILFCVIYSGSASVDLAPSGSSSQGKTCPYREGIEA